MWLPQKYLISVSIGMLLLPVAGYCQFPYLLKIVDPEHYTYEAELKNLADNETVNFTFNGSLISVDIQNATLGSVLQEFSRVTGVNIYLSEYRAQEPVSLKFEKLSLERALQHLLGVNYTLGFTSLPGKKDLSILDLTDIRLVNSVKVAATIRMNKRIRYKTDELIEQSLINGDEEEKILALEALKVNGGKVDDNLLRILASDKSSKVRQLALKEALDHFDNEAAMSLLETAMNTDSDSTVRAYAKTAIANLEDKTPIVASDEAKAATIPAENSKDQTKGLKETENNKDTHPSEKQNTQNSPLDLAEFALQNGDKQERSEALETIRGNNLEVDLDLLLAATTDSSPQNRKLALDAIARRLHPLEAKEILVQRIQAETDPGVKQHAEYRLSSVKSEAEWLYKIKL